jgi:hypothetical protein
MKMNLEHAERSVGNTHEQLERVKCQVDGLHSSLKSHSRIWGEGVKTNAVAIHQVDTKLEALKVSFFNKLEKSNTIIGKAQVQLEEELDKVVACAGERINTKLAEILSNFTKMMEIEEACHDQVKVRLTELESCLEAMNSTNILLATLVTSLQGCVGELKDTVMEESDQKERW